MDGDTARVNRALSAVQRALTLSQVTEAQRQWLGVFHKKLTGLRDRGNGLSITAENRARLERLTALVEDLLERHRSTLN